MLWCFDLALLGLPDVKVSSELSFLGDLLLLCLSLDL